MPAASTGALGGNAAGPAGVDPADLLEWSDATHDSRVESGAEELDEVQRAQVGCVRGRMCVRGAVHQQLQEVHASRDAAVRYKVEAPTSRHACMHACLPLATGYGALCARSPQAHAKA